VAERRVGWTAETCNDLLQVVDFIALDNPLTTNAFLIVCDYASSEDRFVERGRGYRNCAAQDPASIANWS
jgi:hypothetical protein